MDRHSFIYSSNNSWLNTCTALALAQLTFWWDREQIHKHAINGTRARQMKRRRELSEVGMLDLRCQVCRGGRGPGWEDAREEARKSY